LGEAAQPAQRRRHADAAQQAKQSTFLIFNQQFLTLMKAGLPILTSLDSAHQAAAGQVLAAIAGECSRRVKAESFCGRFAAQRVFRNLHDDPAAGEKSGKLCQRCRQCSAEHLFHVAALLAAEQVVV